MSDAARYLSGAKAKRVVIKPPTRRFSLDLGELWRHRELLYFFAWRDIKVRYKQTVIGAAWAVLQPLLAMVVFTLIFGNLADLPALGLPPEVFYYTGVLPWLYFSNAAGATTQAIVGNHALVTKVYFPRVLLPLGSIVAGLVDFAIAFAILLLLMPIFGVAPLWTIIFAPMFIFLLLTCALGVGLWLSSLNAIFRDVRYAVPFLIQLWFFASPVVYPAEMISGKWQLLYSANPMVGVIEGFRWSITGKGQVTTVNLLISIAVSLTILLTGLYFFNRSESYVADVV